MRFLASFHAVFISLSLSFHMYSQKVHTLNVFSSLIFNYHLMKIFFFILPTIPVCISESPRRDEFFFFAQLCAIFQFYFMYLCTLSRRRKKKSTFLKQLNTLFVCISIHVSWHTNKSERKTWQSYLN